MAHVGYRISPCVRPIRGWYLIIRSPSYNNPRTHIALQPLKLRGPENEDRFIFRLKPLHIPLSPAPPSTEGLSGASLPTTVDPIPSPHNRLESASMGSPGSSEPSNPISNNTSDVDAPHVVISSSNLESEASLTSRPMLGSDSQAVQSRMSLRLSSDADDPGVQPSHSYSVTPTEIDFLLRPLTPTVPISAISRLLTFFGDTSKSFCCSRPGSASLIENIMSFEDQTSMFQLATKGDLRIQAEVLTKYGMPMCFWVAIALAYLGFRADKEVCLLF